VKNSQIEAAWKYHNGTKHSSQSVRLHRHYLDWENQPLPLKIYSDLAPIPLPEDLSSSGMAALSAIAGTPVMPGATLTRQFLAEILFLSAGITRRRNYPGGEMLFRAAACTGALYHVDLYVVCGDLEDLAAGVYQFSPQDFSLRCLRAGDYRSVVVHASGAEPAVSQASCVIVSASTFWRNAWKYQARAYRHCYWDDGTILANLLAAAAARGVPSKLVLGFIDEKVTELFALDSRREAPLSLVALGRLPTGNIEASPFMAPLALATEPLSKSEVDYPAMRAMHEASSLENEAEVRAWRGAVETAEDERIKDNNSRKGIFALQPLSDDHVTPDTIEAVITRRGSTREFSREPITFAQLSTALDRATRGLDADFLAAADSPLTELYLIVHAVDGLAPGAYVFRRDERALELLSEGDFRSEAGHLGLDQDIPADCSVNIYFLTDLEKVLARFGNRGYRAAQLEAAIMGGKIYLAAYAQRLGASGLTFYDDEVTEFFSPDAAGKSVMFLVALGKKLKTSRAT